MRKLLIGVGSLVVILVVLVFAAPLLISTTGIKSRIGDAVAAATGRQLTIAGPLRLSLLPPGLTAADVGFANAAGAAPADMVRIKELDIALRPWPLLHGGIEIDHVVLNGPEIALEVDKQGHPNWVFATSAPAAGGGGSTVPGLSLADLRIVDGKVSYADRRDGSLSTLDQIGIRLTRPDAAAALSVSGSARWNGEVVKGALDVPHPNAVIAGGTGALTLKLSGTPFSVAVDGSITGLPPTRMAGTVDLAMPSLRKFGAWAGLGLTPGGQGLGKLSVKGRFERSGDVIAFTDAALSLDAIRAKGALSVALGGKRPALSGRLDVETLDLNPYLPPESAGGSAGWSDAPIDVSGLHAADATLDLAVAMLRYRKLEIGQAALGVVLRGGLLEATLKQAALYGGGGSGRVAVDSSGAVPSLALAANLQNVKVAPLLAAATGNDKLSGTGKLLLDVVSKGASERAMVSTLAGTGSLDLRDGQLAGVNLTGMARNALAAVAGGSGDNLTRFGSLTGTFRIAQGILRNDDMVLTDGPVPVKGAGTVSLPERRVDYRAVVQLVGSASVPILISGPWDSLSYRPDLAGIAQGIVQEPGKALQQLQQGLPGGGSNPLKSLFPR